MAFNAELFETILRLGLALVLGSAIGFERQWNQKMAGLRTNALVALGSCGFVVFSMMIGQETRRAWLRRSFRESVSSAPV